MIFLYRKTTQRAQGLGASGNSTEDLCDQRTHATQNPV
jgi:hypothetical protein